MVVFYININGSVGNQSIIATVGTIGDVDPVRIALIGIGASETQGVSAGLRNEGANIISSHTQGTHIVNPVYLGCILYS